MNRPYWVEYDMLGYKEDIIDVVESKLKFYGGDVCYRQDCILTIKAFFVTKEDRNIARKKIDFFLYSTISEKQLRDALKQIDSIVKHPHDINTEWPCQELPCQELMSR